MSDKLARIAYLDGIRAFAVLAVLGVHWAYPHAGVGRGGYIGVDLFFVLSGYIITKILWANRGSRTYSSFIRGRVRRLYPALIGVVVVAVPIAALLGAFSWSQALLAGAFALTQVNSLIRGLGLADAEPLGITWSLSAEWIFYLLWPLLVLAAVKMTRRRLATIALVTACALFVISLPTDAQWFYYGPVSRGAQLLAGAALALAIHGMTTDARARAGTVATVAAPLALAVLAAYVVAGPSYTSDFYRFAGFPLAMATGAVLILAGEIKPAAPVARALAWAPVAALGRASYSLYLWHYVPLVILNRIEAPVPDIVKAAGAIVLTVVLTLLSYTFLEKPFMKSRAAELARR